MERVDNVHAPKHTPHAIGGLECEVWRPRPPSANGSGWPRPANSPAALLHTATNRYRHCERRLRSNLRSNPGQSRERRQTLYELRSGAKISHEFHELSRRKKQFVPIRVIRGKGFHLRAIRGKGYSARHEFDEFSRRKKQFVLIRVIRGKGFHLLFALLNPRNTRP